MKTRVQILRTCVKPKAAGSSTIVPMLRWEMKTGQPYRLPSLEAYIENTKRKYVYIYNNIHVHTCSSYIYMYMVFKERHR